MTASPRTEVLPRTETRIGFVDVARGIAIWSIVLGHQGISGINRVVFTFHVPIFFLFAGCFFKEEAILDVFLKKNVRALLRPYFIASVALLVFGTAFHVLGSGTRGLYSELAGRLTAPFFGLGGRFPFPFGLAVPGLGQYMPAIGAIWFLLALFWSLVCMRGILRFRGVWQPLAVFCLFEIGIRSSRFFWLPWSIQPGLCALLFVYVGYLAKPILDVQSMTQETRGMLFLFGLCLWWCFIRDFNGFYLVRCYFGRGFADIACSLAACWCVIEVSRFIDMRFPRIASILRFFGRYSLIVLCVHVVELHSWAPVWRKIGHALGMCGVPLSWAKFLVIATKISAIAAVTVMISRIRWASVKHPCQPGVKV